MSAARPRSLTMEDAAGLTRREILDRVAAEQARLLARRSRTPAQNEQLDELMRILQAAGITIEAGLGAAERALTGGPDGWWQERPLSPHQLTTWLDEEQGVVTGRCGCGWTPEGRYFLSRQVQAEFDEHAAAAHYDYGAR